MKDRMHTGSPLGRFVLVLALVSLGTIFALACGGDGRDGRTGGDREGGVGEGEEALKQAAEDFVRAYYNHDVDTVLGYFAPSQQTDYLRDETMGKMGAFCRSRAGGATIANVRGVDYNDLLGEAKVYFVDSNGDQRQWDVHFREELGEIYVDPGLSDNYLDDPIFEDDEVYYREHCGTGVGAEGPASTNSLPTTQLETSRGGDSRSQITAIRGNSELVVGLNRFALALIGEDNRPILDEDVLVRFFYGDELKLEVEAGFTYAIPDANGFYIAQVDFDSPGEWSVEAVLRRDDDEQVATLPLFVSEQSIAPNVGDPAPASENLTLANEPNISRLSTDENPEPALYQTTIAEAITLGKPAVIVFATPAFCQTRFCGPVVENIKEVREDYIDSVTFVHIEPFELDEEGGLVTAENGGPVVVPAMLEWNLQTEPWIFVVGEDGIVIARFEGVAGVSELVEALQSTLG